MAAAVMAAAAEVAIRVVCWAAKEVRARARWRALHSACPATVEAAAALPGSSAAERCPAEMVEQPVARGVAEMAMAVGAPLVVCTAAKVEPEAAVAAVVAVVAAVAEAVVAVAGAAAAEAGVVVTEEAGMEAREGEEVEVQVQILV